MIEYKVDDKEINASFFISFVNQIWEGDYDMERTQNALSKTINITAYDGNVLVGCLRILSDGTILEQLQNYLFFQNISSKGLEADFFSLQRTIHLPCYILARNRG